MTVTPRLAELGSYLYESSYESQFYLVVDAHKQILLRGDTFSRYKTSLDKGSYKLVCEVSLPICTCVAMHACIISICTCLSLFESQY